MPGGCDVRFREIQGARDELLLKGGPWSMGQQAASSSDPRRAGGRRRPRWSYETPPARDEHEWGEFWGAEERRKKGYEAAHGHWYDRAEEESDIKQHVVLLGVAGIVLALMAGVAVAEAMGIAPLLPRQQPATRKLLFTVEESDSTKLRKV